MVLLALFGQVLVYNGDGTATISNTQQLSITSNTAVEEVVYDSYDHIINYHCQFYGIDQELVKIIIEKESEFNPNAVSVSGAIGLMQLMPETAEMLGVKDPYDPWENIMGGVKFLRELFDMFSGDLELTLAAYHAGPVLVKKLNRVPSIPATMEYVDYIVSRYGGSQKSEPIFLTLTEDGTPLFTNR